MHYRVEVQGETFEVELSEDGQGLAARIGQGEFAPVNLEPAPAPLHQLAWGARRAALRLEEHPHEPGVLRIALPGRGVLNVEPLDARAVAAGEGRAASKAKGPGVQRSPMPGVVIEVRVAAGQEVQKGQILLILEAMKMQNEIRAERPGVVSAVHVSAGQAVAGGAKLLEYAALAE
ncbi:MAG: biotin/lipoyl-containing protein [Planctomycetota bacterium]